MKMYWRQLMLMPCGNYWLRTKYKDGEGNHRTIRRWLKPNDPWIIDNLPGSNLHPSKMNSLMKEGSAATPVAA